MSGNACLTHCCPRHGCKYSYDSYRSDEGTCPVSSGAAEPQQGSLAEGGCEFCSYELKSSAGRIAWQLALHGRLSANAKFDPYYVTGDPKDRIAYGVLRLTLRLHNGTAEGEHISVTGNTTNEVFQKMRNALLDHYPGEDY